MSIPSHIRSSAVATDKKKLSNWKKEKNLEYKKKTIKDVEFNVLKDTGKLVLELSFYLNEKKHNFFLKAGLYDYGKYDQSKYNKLNEISIDSCCLSNNKYYLNSKFVYESIIYEKMTRIEMNDKRMKDKIVKLNFRGIIKNGDILIKINDIIYNINLSTKIKESYKNLFELTEKGSQEYGVNQENDIEDKNHLYYFITEKDDDYINLQKLLESERKINNDRRLKYLKLAKKICSDLNYMYTKYNFIHWDLHRENILIKKDLTSYKLFDFDLSQLTYNGLKYNSCNYYDYDEEKLYIRETSYNKIINIKLDNAIDYYSLLLRDDEIDNMFLSSCIGSNNTSDLINEIGNFFRETFDDSNINEFKKNSNENIISKYLIVNEDKFYNKSYKIYIGAMMLYIYLNRNPTCFLNTFLKKPEKYRGTLIKIINFDKEKHVSKCKDIDQIIKNSKNKTQEKYENLIKQQKQQEICIIL
jgi:hypothetical protein